ncbi:sensor histidine kinase [Calothrix sp. 336/3]|uniref:sensor histidine kinase n=1 Tax=Calothrix sp. 336/3 TaxID=1337936 RepID=UPI0004E3B3C8|nr:GAF domain-containing protein [Calothrix sp. 336/3]AKG22221.1 ATP-binding protein [Calothrix sp. 336/3]
MLPPQKLTAAEQQIFSLGRILQSLREENTIESLIATTVRYLQEDFEYKLIWIAMYDRLNHILLGQGGITPSNDKNYLKQHLVLNPGDLLEQVVTEQRPLGVADLRAELRAQAWQQLAQKYEIQGTIVLPIRYKNHFLGVILLGSQRWGYLLGGEARARLMMILGELGAAWYQLEIDSQNQQSKHPEEKLLKLLENIRNLQKLELKLNAVVEATQEFVLPSRTNIYWLDTEGRYFWRRASNKSASGVFHHGNQQIAGITIQELSDFYYALSVNELVFIGDGRSSFQSNCTVKLLQRLKVRSLLAAPILRNKDLLGFLTVESSEPRIWGEAEQNFVRGAAGLISLVTPLDEVETTVRQIQDDAYLSSQIAQGIYTNKDVQEILDDCAARVLQRLGASRFLLLHFDSEQNQYQIFYQNQLPNRRGLNLAFETPKDIDWQLLAAAEVAVGIENLEDDLRFFQWRPNFIDNGVRSLLISNSNPGNSPLGLLVVTSDTPRHWISREKELVQVVSQQLGVIVRQWQLQRQTEQQQKILHSTHQCLRVLGQSQNTYSQSIEKLQYSALQQIGEILHSPAINLLYWSPGDAIAQIYPGIITDSQFAINPEAIIPISEPLIHWAVTNAGLLSFKLSELPAETRKWLHGSAIGQVLVMGLHTADDYETTGVILITDHRERQWSEESLYAVENLIFQLAWLRRNLQINTKLHSKSAELQQLNWYKHRRLEDIQKSISQILGQMHDLGIPTTELTQMRYQQLLRQLDNTNASMTTLLKLEQWQLHRSWETVTIASLLKRSLERVDNLLKIQRLWVGVHGLGQEDGENNSNQNYSLLPISGEKPQTLSIAGDMVKIELILHELIMTACQRAHTGSRIDIWCRRLDADSLELSITDNGTIEPQLLVELNPELSSKDVLAPSTLEKPPGLHMAIARTLMQQLGGDLQFYQLPDSRLVSRLILPLAGE